MTGVAQLKTYSAPPICEREILRYAACKTPDSQTLSLLNECLLELDQSARYKVSYALSPVAIEGDICDFGAFKVQSANLCKRLDGCQSAVVFVASAGMQMDRLITKYAQIQPSKALLLGAIGTALVESLCDEFCADIAAEYGVYLSSTPASERPGLKSLPDDTVICIRKLPGISDTKKKTQESYARAEETLRLILADKAPE